MPFACVGAGIVFSELHWSGSDLSSADEWIELTNTSSGTVSLSGWILTRFSGGADVRMLTIPGGMRIGSGGIFLIANNDADSSQLAIDPNFVDASVSLANTQLFVRLYDASGALVDSADDGVGTPFAGSVSPFASMERIDLSGSGQTKSNWKTAATFLNFDDGASIFGTPGAKNGAGPSIDVFPPIEATSFAAELSSQTSTGAVGALHATPLQVSWMPSISLDLSSQTLLWNGTGMILSKTATGVSFPGIGTGVTFTLRTTDKNGNTSTGITTVSRLFPTVKITEVLANPAGIDDEEWIEVANLGKEIIDLGGWILDEGNSPGDFRFPSPLLLRFNEHRIFRKSQTALPLQNNGEVVTLKRGFTIMDTWSYGETAEEVSFGRRRDSSLLQAFCVPTPSKPNDIIAPDPAIMIQSGNTHSERSVALNLVVSVLTGSTAHATCAWNYGDGFISESCNPPSHTFGRVGSYEIRLTYKDFCANTVEKSITVTVLPDSSNGGNTGGAGQSGGASGGSSGEGSGNRTSCTPTHFEGIRLSEFLPNPDGKDEEKEWIELENTLSENVSLCGWELDDAEGGSKPFVLDTFVMPPQGFLLLERPQTKIAINNSDESIRLFKPGKTMIEEIMYDKSSEAESYALRDDSLFVWTPFLTPGQKNRFREVSSKSPGESVIISAVLPNPEGKDEGNEWIEVTNVGKSSVDLRGWQLDNRRDSRSPYTIESRILEPQAVRRFTAELTGIMFTNTEDEARLLDPLGNVVSLIHWVNATSGRIYRPSEAGKKVEAFVITVIDGDTIDVEIEGKKERVRMIGIDTPETVHPNKAVERFGKEASDFTKMMLTKKKVILEFGDEERDKYGRVLAYVLLSDGMNFNGLLIRRGLAYAYLRFPFVLSALFRAYEEEARNAKLGLWADEEATVAILEIKNEEEKNEEIAITGSGSTASGSTLSGSTLISAMTGSVETPHAASLQFNPFNEVMSNPSKEGHLHDLGEYIELWNPTDEIVTLEKWILDDAPSESSKPKKLNEKYSIEPRGYLLLCKGEECDLPLSISLNNDGEAISLTSPDGGTVFSVTYPELDRGEAYAFHNNAWCITGTATPSMENICLPFIDSNIKKQKSAGPLRQSSGQAPLQQSLHIQQKNPLDVLRTKYRHIYAEEDHPKETPKEFHPLLHTILEKTEIQKMHATLVSPISATIAHLSLLGSLGSLSLLGSIYTRRKVRGKPSTALHFPLY